MIGTESPAPRGVPDDPRRRQVDPDGRLGTLWTFVAGRPLRSSHASKEQITPLEGLPALSLDALTSVAYGPEAILIVLATAGAGALPLSIPILGAIVVLLAVLVMSYRQVIDGYPGGGGAYAVSRANLGRRLSLLAAASLVVDYTLTVAVSIAAGVAALTSAFPVLSPYTLWMSLGILGTITVANLRGLGEAARAFLLPTMVFIVGLLAVIAVGLVHPLAPRIHQPGASLVARSAAPVGVFLILKAFAAGCSALTGVEAIANGVPLFREPRVARAKTTELLLGLILGTMLLGLGALMVRFHIDPRDGDTVLSQVTAAAVGRGWAYYTVSLSVTAVLALAANTSFGGLPVLASLLARDNFAPHTFAMRGDRLVYSRGVWVLTALSAALLVATDANTNALIPLFAIGVFTGFTLAQTGMVVHWNRERPRRWRRRAAVNSFGATLTAAATVIFLITKFTAGAWVVAVTVPLIMVGFEMVNRYYGRIGEVLQLGSTPPIPEPPRILVIVPVSNISTLTAQALSDARAMSENVVAVSVVFAEDNERAARFQQEWDAWAPGTRLVMLKTEYHSVVRPIVRFVKLALSEGHHRIVVLIPVLEPPHWRQHILHNQVDLALSESLRHRSDVVVARSVMRVGGFHAPHGRHGHGKPTSPADPGG